MSRPRVRPLLIASFVVALAATTTAPVAAAAVPEVTICQIQGDGARSPYAPDAGNGYGDRVETQGVVTAVEPDGFYLQDPGCDDDPATSDGIFVYTGWRDTTADVGDRYRVSASVQEYYDATQLSGSSARYSTLTELSAGNPVPDPVRIDPEAAGSDRTYYETLEHMQVELAFGQTHVGTNQYGETFLVPRAVDSRIRRTDHAPDLLAIDDELAGVGSLDAWAFDTIEGAVGPLAFTFDNYKLMLADPDAVEVTRTEPDRPAPVTPVARSKELAVAAWNLENVFDETEDGGPATPEPSLDEQAVKRAKVVAGIAEWLDAPPVVAVQEVEKHSLLEAIAEDLNEHTGTTAYVALLEEGNDPRGIDVGFLVDTARVAHRNVRQLAPAAVSDGRCEGGASGELVWDRVPLAVDVKHARGGWLTVVSNHFKSKFGGTEDNDFFEDCRVEQAEVLRDAVADLDRVALAGDFNAFRDSRTLAVLTAGGYENLVDRIPTDRRFSYVFQGRVQFLDHVVVSAPVARTAGAMDSPKIGSDVPVPAFEADPATAFAASDHDPLVAGLR